MHLFEWLANNSWGFLICVGILGLLIGSFLNVVILRLPIMLQKDWIAQCQSYLKEGNTVSGPLEKTSTEPPFNLMVPCSHCPHCKHPISALENIPVLSFLVLKGHCKACKAPISWRYPIVEMATALLSLITAFHFGFAWITLAALLLTWSLLVLTVIDLDHQILPDDITLSVLWLGLLVNISSTFTTLPSAIIGAVAGYLFLWCVFWLFKLMTQKEGMGYGDFKLLAMLGAWLGWKALPLIILLSSLVGTLVGVSLILLKQHGRSQPMPFGPFLALAGWIALIWGDKITELYLNFAHIP